jgi:chromate transporter
LKLLLGLRQHALGFPLVVLLASAAFAGVVWLHLALHLIVLGLGGLACGLTWWLLRQRVAQ